MICSLHIPPLCVERKIEIPLSQATHPSTKGASGEQTFQNESNPREASGTPGPLCTTQGRKLSRLFVLKAKEDLAGVVSESGGLPCGREEALRSSGPILRLV